jgi:hypothetical protein
MALSVPSAIVMGSVIIGGMVGTGVYLGLREKAPVAAPSVPAPVPVPLPDSGPFASPSTPTTMTSSTAAAPPGADAGTVADAGANAAAEVKRQLEPLRATVGRECFTAAITKGKTLATAAWTLNITFGPDGTQLMRGIADDPDHRAPAELTACVQRTLPPLTIPPTGARAYVEVPFSAP